MPPALHVQPAPAESCAQRASAQSPSSALSHALPAAPSVQTLRKPLLEYASTQCPELHCELAAQGSPSAPLVQKLPDGLLAQLPLLQLESSLHGSPTAPEEHLPVELWMTQVRPLAHWSEAAQVLPAWPSLHVPVDAPVYDFAHKPLWQSLAVRQLEPSEPSPHTPRLSAVAPTQMLLLQSFETVQADAALPSLQRPTKEEAGSTHERPALQSALALQLEPAAPSWHFLVPSS